MRLDIYLNYGGNCEQAFRFYEQHLGGKITMMIRHGEQPDRANVPADWKTAIPPARIGFYGRTRQPTINPGSLILGSPIEGKQYYDLEARDISGRTWRASRVIVGESGATGVVGRICQGRLRGYVAKIIFKRKRFSSAFAKQRPRRVKRRTSPALGHRFPLADSIPPVAQLGEADHAAGRVAVANSLLTRVEVTPTINSHGHLLRGLVRKSSLPQLIHKLEVPASSHHCLPAGAGR